MKFLHTMLRVTPSSNQPAIGTPTSTMSATASATWRSATTISIKLVRICAAGAGVIREPGPMARGGTHIAFIEDPNGYKIELIDLTCRA